MLRCTWKEEHVEATPGWEVGSRRLPSLGLCLAFPRSEAGRVSWTAEEPAQIPAAARCRPKDDFLPEPAAPNAAELLALFLPRD